MVKTMLNTNCIFLFSLLIFVLNCSFKKPDLSVYSLFYFEFDFYIITFSTAAQLKDIVKLQLVYKIYAQM